MNLTKEALMVGTGCSDSIADAWLVPMQKACAQFGVDKNPQRLASFLANVGVESMGLTRLVENLNYSTPQRLAVVWPTRFAIDPHVPNKVPNSTAYLYAGKPQALANFVYANRLGNGAVSSGDGWRYRGQGPIQLTGKSNFTAYFEAAGLPLDTDPATLQQPVNGSGSAAHFFANSGAFAAADSGDFDQTVKCVNGALPGSANQGDLRRHRFQAVLPVLMAAPAPTTAARKTPTKATQSTEQSTQ